MDDATEALLLRLKTENPDWGRTRLARETCIPPATVQRWMDRYKLAQVKSAGHPDKLIAQIAAKYNPSELKAILDGTKSIRVSNVPTYTGKSHKFLVISDTHVGHSRFSEEWWETAMLKAEDEDCDFVYHVGDILEGMSGRPGHVYELSEIGFDAQFRKATDLIGQSSLPIRGITGNHDLWYQAKADIGINVGEHLERACENWTHLGDNEGDDLLGDLKVKLFHGNDGASYAASYRGQKLVESFSGGEKPHILLMGHAHKAIYHQCRGVQVLESGTLCAQTSFMRGKKLQAHTGFWIIETQQGDCGLEKFAPSWYPFWKPVA